ncbi:hypothetical protein EB796_007972 [Bugula neritina]|uniref:Uncharacterized protein n=1 Tax=Bugula neritina TaxID=10212 RepID=A0A7J7K824_BUGNE|nr:hypothetical protein EB796_007972 [Bugula neritina]
MIGYCQLMREHNTYYYDSLCIVPTALEQKSFVQAGKLLALYRIGLLNKTENGDYKAKFVYFSSNMSSSSTRVSNSKPKI